MKFASSAGMILGASLVCGTQANNVRGLGWWEKDNGCPNVKPVKNFDIERYISSSWYVQMQQENPYQKKDDLFCVTATYKDEADSAYIKVDNYANKGEVNGPSMGGGSAFSDLCAKQKKSGTGKLKVGPCLFRKFGLFDFLSGPYWVIAVDEVNYDWAIISGGKPDQVRNEDPLQCTTKIGNSFLDTNGSGLWLFTRASTGEEADNYTAAMIQILTDMGVYTGDLLDVVHEGCKYEGASLK